jgi:hypothetical protein
MNQPSGIEANDRWSGTDSTTTQRSLSPEEETLPEDALTEPGIQDFTLEKRAKVSPDDTLAKQATHYLSQERREKLDQQIEALYDRVAHELNDNPTDVSFALKKLQQAHDVVFEDTWRYEEALYWITEIKKMLLKKYTWRRWSYTWGVFAFFYALIWLFVFIVGFFINATGWLPVGNVTGIWFSALAGGLGSVVAILYHLYWHISIKVDFDRQYLMNYFIQPIIGWILGGVIFLITNAGFILIDARSLEDTGTLIDGVQAFQILLGFWAGFNQQVVYSTIDAIVRRLSPKKQT